MIQSFLAKRRSLFWHPHVKEMKARAARSWERLRPVQDHTARIRPGARLLMTMGRDENPRIPYFLEYYRALGIDHFLFVDNQSESPMADVLTGQADVSLWHTDEGYAETRYGVDWMNALLSRYAVGHWTLTVDLDEFFVYPFMETRSYGDLIAMLEDLDKLSMFTTMVDMYPEGPISSAHGPAADGAHSCGARHVSLPLARGCSFLNGRRGDGPTVARRYRDESTPYHDEPADASGV